MMYIKLKMAMKLIRVSFWADVNYSKFRSVYNKNWPAFIKV